MLSEKDLKKLKDEILSDWKKDNLREKLEEDILSYAVPADAVLPSSDGWVFTEICNYRGLRVEVWYYFSRPEMDEAGDDHSNLPWDDDHIDRVILSTDEEEAELLHIGCAPFFY